MRFLTRKEREYLERLKQRNSLLLKEEKDQTKLDRLWHEGLSNPTSPTERQMRRRIRRKAIAAMFDLVLVGNAGVLPDQKLRKQGVKSVAGMIDDIDNFMIIRMVAEKDEF